MLKNALQAMTAASRSLLRDWQVAAVFSGVYASLLAVCYFFAVTKEATISQVLLTFALALAAIVLFYTLQAMSVSYTQRELRPHALVWQSLKTSWRLMLITLPLILFAWLTVYMATRNQWPTLLKLHELAPARNSAPWAGPMSIHTKSAFNWIEVVLVSLRLVFFGVVLPLAAMHLWIAAAQDGLRQALMKTGRIMARAFAPQTMLIYTIGLIVFGLIPCALLFVRTPTENAWVEVGLLTARLALGLLFFLFGWVVTLGALAGEISSSMKGRMDA